MTESEKGRETIDSERLNAEQFCYLTTTGRVSGRPHEIEIWFGLTGDTLYMLSGGGEKSDWVKNLRRDPRVSVRVGKQTFPGTARIVTDPGEEAGARGLLADKYEEREDDGSLSEWAGTALPIAVDLET